jgi:hypothetical protein
VRTEARKAASNNGFRLDQGVDGGWLRFGSTTAHVVVWIAGASGHGPWLLSVDRPEVGAELGRPMTSGIVGPTPNVFAFDTLQGLYDALDRVYRLGVSLPDAPLNQFRAAVHDIPGTTEAERLVVQRVGQGIFRQALLAYWGGRCPLTGITEPALLRASHIVPWSECDDEQRLDVHNGLLLSALWDAAFDAGLVSFADDGAVLASPALTAAALTEMRVDEAPKIKGLTPAHRHNLGWHRARYGF